METLLDHKDQIIINLGVEHYWISIIHEYSNATKELALCHMVNYESGSVGVECVPLNKWFDNTRPDYEVTIELYDIDYLNRYRIGDVTTEAQLIVSALERASKYVYLTKTISTETEK